MSGPNAPRLEERIRKLAFEKSYLELVVRLMSRLGGADGVDDAIATLLASVVDVLGGTNAALYYDIDGRRCYADAYGARRDATPDEDADVARVFETREPIERAHDFEETRLTTPAFTRAYTWIHPLVAGGDVIGVLRIENLHIGTDDLRAHLPLVFAYAAQVIRNEVQNYARMRDAYHRVNAANAALTHEIGVRQEAEAALRTANDTLETHVVERTLELTRANDRLQRELGERLRADEALRRRNRELGALNRLLGGAADDIEPASLLALACRELATLLDVPLVHASLVTSDDQHVSVVAEHAPESATSLVGRAASRGATALLRDLHATGAPMAVARVPGDGQASAFASDFSLAGITSLLAVPLVIERRVVGCLALSTFVPREFTAVETGLATSVAAHVAASLARLQARADARRLRVAIEQTPASVVITDPDGRIVYVNPTFTTTTGYTMAEAIGQSTRVLKSGVHPDAFYQQMWKTLMAGESWHGRLTNRKKSGELFTEDAVIVAVHDERGRVVNYIAVKRDITRELAQEEHLRHAQRMDGIGQLAGGVAHDFNNILGAMIMQLEVVRSEPGLPAGVLSGLDEISAAAGRAATLTRQLLTFSRRQAMNVGSHDLNMVVRQLLSLLERLLGEGIHVDFTPSEHPLVFEGDAAMIEQVIVNLCVNARDAMPGGGTLAIDLEPVVRTAGGDHRLREVPPAAFAALRVRDSGCGMPPDVLQHLFEPFFTTKDVGRGTGLGLATSHGIVSQHHGWIDVESHVGRGSTFTVYLPTADRTADAKTRENRSPVDTGHASILLVEDEPTIRRITHRCLTRLGYDVVEANDGTEALDAWAKSSGAIDLLLTDVVMPNGVSGIDLSRRLRLEQPALKVILMSGYPADLVRDGATIDAGVAYLAKPFSISSLGQTVSRVLAGA
ncbi:MAG: response regulator [Acidobacteria bacterium]|nr:response regulator [Acidobacteriota bacterium]